MSDTPASAASRWIHSPRRFWGTLLILGLAVPVLGVPAVRWLLDSDIANILSLVFLGAPWVALLIIFAVRSGFPPTVRYGMIGLVVLANVAFWSYFRVVDFSGDLFPKFAPRFAPRPDEELAATKTVPGESPAVPNGEAELSPGQVADLATTRETDYPRFLGADGRAHVAGVTLARDWRAEPPTEKWRQKIGAGWSAFAVVGDFAVTQEQRGADELVTCYRVADGDLVWSHIDRVRFSSSQFDRMGLGGDGPRATPTIHEGKVYAQGATGILNCLDGATGRRLWSHDIIAENEAKQISWGRSGSPLVAGDLVIVCAGGPNGRSVVAYHKETGERVWSGGDDRASYASPALAVLAGEEQVLSLNEMTVTAHSLADGKVLWDYPWKSSSDGDANAAQPVAVGGDRVFLAKGYGQGSALLQISKSESGFKPVLLWERPANLRTKMTNAVLRDGHLYGLSAGILECVEVDSGKRRWKRGRYGHGQVLLVEDLLLITSESGDLALVEATPEQYRELSKIKVFDDKTWNTPALSGRRLLLRNHLEAVCLELP